MAVSGRVVADYSVGAVTDVGKRRLGNEDAYRSDPRMDLHVVSDGIGGQPSGEAASQLVAHSYGPAVLRCLRGVSELTPRAMGQVMADAARLLSDAMVEQATAIPALESMGATMVAALLDRNAAYIAHVGDSRVYLFRDGQLQQLTEDQTRSVRRALRDDSGRPAGVRDARLIVDFLGRQRTIEPTVQALSLRPEDRLLLCSDGLSDPVPFAGIAHLLASSADPRTAAEALVEAALDAGGPDNVTALVIDYHGTRPAEPRPAARVSQSPKPRGLARELHLALQQVEQPLQWLKAGAEESVRVGAGGSTVSAMAAVKRRLGQDTFRKFLDLRPTRNPAHVFHRACTMPDSDWRRGYAARMAVVAASIKQLRDEPVALSPLLSPDQTAEILLNLWQGWRRVEARYFASAQRDALHGQEQTLNILIDHMVSSVRTIIGLLEMFPRFMREAEMEEQSAVG